MPTGDKTSIEHARDVRDARAALLRDLGDGAQSLREVLSDPPTCISRCDLWTVLLRTNKLGIAGANKVCTDAQVWPLAPIETLSFPVRERIIANLPKRVT